MKQKNLRHTNLLSRRHFEAVPECCAQSLPVAASVTGPLKIPAQFDNCYCPRPPGEIQRYKGVTPRLCPRYSPAMFRGSGGRGLH